VRTRRFGSLANSHGLWGPVYALPALLMVLVFVGYPFGSIVYHSFTHWDGIVPARWIGFRNYEALWHDPLFLGALKNNFIFAAMVPIQLVGALVLAYLIHDRIPGWRFFRSTFFLPAVFSTVTVGILATQFLQLNGPLNGLLSGVGLGGLTHNWLAAPITSIPAILLVVVWANFGYSVIIYLGGLSTIDPSLPEAAELDGAGRWRTLWHVVVPNLRPVMELVLVINTITAFAYMFTYIYVMTGGGPGFETYVTEFLIYNEAFSYQELGYASATGFVLVLIIAALGFLQIRVMTGGRTARGRTT
jgi:multiple sugar transport system permease protein